MTGAERIESALRRAVAAGRPGLAAFVTAGYPAKDDFGALVQRVAEAADVVEIGVPFSDPMADGVTIQRASRAALAQGVSLRDILAVLGGLRLDTPLVVMSYLNPLLALGVDALPAALARANVAGVIVPDLPFEEGRELDVALDAHGIALIQLVTPVTPPERLALLCGGSRGFVYAVAMTGTTGGRAADPAALAAYLARVRSVAPVPVLAGFGIRSRAQVAELAPHVDGVIVGSALIEALERGDDPVSFLNELKGGR